MVEITCGGGTAKKCIQFMLIKPKKGTENCPSAWTCGHVGLTPLVRQDRRSSIKGTPFGCSYSSSNYSNLPYKKYYPVIVNK